ncbi:MAG: hypothetical protein WCC52_03780 [Nitrosotalea sp.]
MKIEKEVEDARGRIIFLSYDDKQVNMVEMRKGFSRGGHYHKAPTKHIVIIGRIEYRGKYVDTEHEKIQVFLPNEIIDVPANEAHLLTALEDSLFLEVFEKNYEATNFPEYRNIVESKIKN